MNSRQHARILALPVCAFVAHSGPTPIDWTNPMGGYWGVDSNWGTFASPTLDDHAQISLPGVYAVTVGADEQAASLQLTNPTATLGIGNARTLILHGDVLNDGLILINSESFASQSKLRFESGATIGGSGTLRLNAPGLRSQLLGPPAGEMLVHGMGHKIEGSGTINAELINDATIRANVPSEELTLLASAMSNNAILEAVDGSALILGAMSLTQSPGAILQARGPGSRIELNGTALVGGELFADSGANIEARNASMGANVLSAGIITVRDDDSLTITDTIRNEGRISLNPSSEGAANLHFSLSTVLFGSGTIELGAPDSTITAEPDVSITNSVGHTVSGQGTIEVDFINDGIIYAQSAGGELRFLRTSVLNTNTLGAKDSSTLAFQYTTIMNSDAAIIANDTGSRIILENVNVVGGKLHALNGAIVEVHGATLDTVDFRGSMSVEPNEILYINNSITNRGTINLNGDDNGAGSPRIHFNEDGAFLGDGSIRMNARLSGAQITSFNDEVTVSEGQTISGSGRITARIRNRGLILADVPSERITFLSFSNFNHSTIRAENGARLVFDRTLTNEGDAAEVIADGADSSISFYNGVRQGRIIARNGAEIFIHNGTLELVECTGTIHIPQSSEVVMLPSTNNNGTIVINSDGDGDPAVFTWIGSHELGGEGTIRLNAQGLGAQLHYPPLNTPARFGPGQRLEGIGTIFARLRHSGTTAPGLGIGTLFVNDSIIYEPTSIFEAEIGPESNDRLESTSSVTLNGTLRVVLSNGFVPDGYWARTIIIGTTITDRFTAIDAPEPPEGLITRVYNTGTELIVGQTCLSDFNLDGELNFFDVSEFLTRFGDADPEADLNGDGLLNFFDVSAFLINYSDGC